MGVIGLHITPAKVVETVEIEDLADYQRLVNGYIEAVRLDFDGEEATLFVNEEYLYQYTADDVNWTASDIAGRGGRVDLMITQPILGPAVLVGGVDSHGNTLSLGPKATRWAKKVAGCVAPTHPEGLWGCECPECKALQRDINGDELQRDINGDELVDPIAQEQP